MINILFFLSKILFLIQCFEEYKNICFTILGSENKAFSMFVNSKTNFIPETLRVILIATINGNSYSKKTYESQFFIKKSGQNSCDESFVIPYFMGSETFSINIMIEVWYAKGIKIDFCYKYINSPLLKQTIIIDGLDNVLKFPLIIDEKLREFPKYIPFDVKWSTEINCKINLCMRVFNFPGLYNFMSDLKCLLSNSLQLNKFSYLIITPYRNADMTGRTYRVKYIAEIFECDEHKHFSKLNIVLGDHINSFKLNVFDHYNKVFHIIGFSFKDGIFKKIASSGYISNLLEVEIIREHSLIVPIIRSKRMSSNDHHEKSIFYNKNGHLFSLTLEKQNERYYVKNASIFVKDEEKKKEYFREATEKEIDGDWPAFFVLD